MAEDLHLHEPSDDFPFEARGALVDAATAVTLDMAIRRQVSILHHV